MRILLASLLAAAASAVAAQPAAGVATRPAAGVPGRPSAATPVVAPPVAAAPIAASTEAASPAPPEPAAPSAAMPGPGLPELVERAWAIARQAGIAAARGAELDARALATRYPFADAPTVGADLRRDQPRWAGLPGTDAVPERGRNEIDLSLSAPIWLPGQREAARRVIERERGLLDAATLAERLRVAGEVREAAWALALAASEQRLQRARLESARALETDVARRVAAGDLAPADTLMARTETLAAAVAAREAQSRVEAAASLLRRLTGLDAAGELAEAPAGQVEPGAHPLLAAARESADAARARLALARTTRRDNPTLSATTRFDRDAYGTGYRNTMTVGIAVPLDTEARNAPRLAAASADLTEAEIALERRRRELAGEAERARIALEAARAAFDTNRERAATAREAQAALERAFRAGERSLPDVLRVRAQTLEAELARDTAREQLGLSIARLNQSLGIQP